MTTSNKLERGVQILYDLELNNFLMEKGINALDQEASYLAKPRFIGVPQRKSCPFWDSFWTFAQFVLPICGLLSAIIGAIELLCTAELLSILFAGIFFVGAYGILGILCGVPICLIITLFYQGNKNKNYKKLYDEELCDYHIAVECENLRLKKETAQKNALLQQRKILYDKYVKSLGLLENYYRIIGIDEKFQNIICIGYINEYFRLNITNKLDGIDGAYNLLRSDLKFETVKGMLEKISYQLDEVLDRQHILYTQLSDMNQKCNTLISSTISSIRSIRNFSEQTAYNASVIAYNTERTERELAFQNFMLLY